jgi:hypothetical protein
MNLLGRVLSIARLPENRTPVPDVGQGVSSGQTVDLFNGLYTTNQSAHHALLMDDETTSQLGANVMTLSSMMRSLLAAYACGAAGAAVCEFARPE